MYCVLNIGFKRCPTSRDKRLCVYDTIHPTRNYVASRDVGSDKEKNHDNNNKNHLLAMEKEKTYITQHITHGLCYYYYYYYRVYGFRVENYRANTGERRTPVIRRAAVHGRIVRATIANKNKTLKIRISLCTMPGAPPFRASLRFARYFFSSRKRVPECGRRTVIENSRCNVPTKWWEFR